MKYAFLTMLVPKQMEQEVKSQSTYNMQDAANALQWHIYEGLSANLPEGVRIFNVLPIGSFPQYYTKAFVKKTMFDAGKSKGHVNIGFCNVKLLRRYHQPGKIYNALKKWCAEGDEDKTLFVYTVSAPFMTAVARLKNQFPKLRVCAIIADLPDMCSLSSKKTMAKRLFERSQASASYSRLACVDAFVLLTEQMADYMGITQPYMVMEGISTAMQNMNRAEPGHKKQIFYAGTLHEKFGIINLVEAFQKIDNPYYRLVICGVGDSEARIRQAAEKDDRIDFKGQLKREDVLELQQGATVLVNPRQNNEEFTKYSFPSKNLEYLSSGVPLVAYKLDGIPDEYDSFINYVPDDSVETLRDKLIEVCEDADGAAKTRALHAATFVKEEKNAQRQTSRIIKMLEAICETGV